MLIFVIYFSNIITSLYKLIIFFVAGLKTKADIKESVFLMQDVLNNFRKT